MKDSPRYLTLPRRAALVTRACLTGLVALLLAACGGGGGGGGGASFVPPPPATLTITTTSLADGVNGEVYLTQTLQASGGTGARTWSETTNSFDDSDGTGAAGAACEGLVLDFAAGTISGTPAGAGTCGPFTIQVADSGSPQQTDTQDLSIRVVELLVISTMSLPNTTEDATSYPDPVQATGGVGPYTWSVSAGQLPTGLDLDGSMTETLGFIGQPSGGNVFNFTLQVTDSTSTPQMDEQDFEVRVLEITTTGVADGVQNEPYNAGLSLVGEVGAVTWSEPGVLGSGNCAGLALDAGTGTISGTPTSFGTCGPFTISATDSDTPPRTDTQSLSILIAEDLQITTPSLPGGTALSPYNETITATGGTIPFAWSEASVPTNFFDDATGQGAPGTACEGLTLDFSATGVTTTVSGTPVNGGTCGPFTVRVDDAGAPTQFDTQALSIVIAPAPLIITTGALPSGAVNRSYNATLEASGGTPPFTWSEPTTSFDNTTGAGALATPCQGLTLDLTSTSSTTTISGTPAFDGTCGGAPPFTIRIDDSAADFDTSDFSIVVNPEPVGAGRNDTVQNAVDLVLPAIGQEVRVSASISPYGAVTADTPNPGDNDFYRITAPVDAEVSIEVFAKRLVGSSSLDSVIEIVTDDSSPLGARILGACRNEGTSDGLDPGAPPDPTPNAFDDNCVNDDIILGGNRDSKLTYKVQAGAETFFVRVLDFRGDARPDFVYELVIIRLN